MSYLVNPFITGNDGGPGVPPVFGDDVWLGIEHQAAPSGGLFDFTGHDLTGCQRLRLELADLVMSIDDAAVLLELYMGDVLHVNGYSYRTNQQTSGGSLQQQENETADAITLNDLNATVGIGNAAGENFNAVVTISGINRTVFKLVSGDAAYVLPSGNLARVAIGAALLRTEPVVGLRVRAQSGTISSGTATLYGLANSDPAVLESLWTGALT